MKVGRNVDVSVKYRNSPVQIGKGSSIETRRTLTQKEIFITRKYLMINSIACVRRTAREICIMRTDEDCLHNFGVWDHLREDALF